jgi:hypothetical protein
MQGQRKNVESCIRVYVHRTCEHDYVDSGLLAEIWRKTIPSTIFIHNQVCESIIDEIRYQIWKASL